MVQVFKGYNSDTRKDITLTKLQKKLPTQARNFEQCTFVRYGVYDLTGIDTNTNNFNNLFVRAETGNNGERVSDMQSAFKRDGYDFTKGGGHPPALDLNNKIIDGRTRIEAAIRNGETQIPVAIYDRTDDSNTNSAINGLRANVDHETATKACKQDFVQAAVGLIANGELKRDAKSISSFLVSAGVRKVYDNSVNGQITRIEDEIFNKSRLGTGLTICKDRKTWEDWCVNNVGLTKGEFHLKSVDSLTYAYRFWTEQVLPAAALATATSEPYSPPNLVLYTKSAVENVARKNLKEFVDQLETLCSSTYAYFEAVHGAKFQEKQPFVILGAIPQIVNSKDHKAAMNANSLICVSKY